MDDVQEMVSALMVVVSGVERAKRQGQAGALATLYLIAAREPIRPTDLSIELGVHQSSVTRQIRAMVAVGQVHVVADAADGRSCFISLTDTGREEIRRLTEVGLGRFAGFVEDWDAEEVRTLARLLNKLEVTKAEAAKRAPRTDSWRTRSERK